MNPKEKAESLTRELSFKAPLHHEETIDVALMIVNEITLALINEGIENLEFWYKVKTELKNL